MIGLTKEWKEAVKLCTVSTLPDNIYIDLFDNQNNIYYKCR